MHALRSGVRGNDLAWNDNPTDEERLMWFVKVFQICQAPAAAETLDKTRSSFAAIPLSERQDLLGRMWRQMESAYSQRLGTKQHLSQARVTQKFQITLPTKARKSLGGVEPGDCILFSMKETESSSTSEHFEQRPRDLRA